MQRKTKQDNMDLISKLTLTEGSVSDKSSSDSDDDDGLQKPILAIATDKNEKDKKEIKKDNGKKGKADLTDGHGKDKSNKPRLKKKKESKRKVMDKSI